MQTSGNVIRVLITERVGQGSTHPWSIILTELNGTAFQVVSGTYDLISKVSPFTEKIAARPITPLPDGDGFQGTVTPSDTDTPGEYLLVATLTMATGGTKFVVQDWTVEDVKELAKVL